MMVRSRDHAPVLLALALLAGCNARDADMSGSPGRGLEQDIAATRYGEPDSARPGAVRSVFEPLGAPSVEESKLAEKPEAPSAPTMGIAGLASGEAGSGNPAAGRRFAFDNCRPCHVVAPDQSSAVRFANAPDFRAIANAPGATGVRLMLWLTNPHPTMPTLILTPQEARDVIAYLQNLRTGR